MPRPISMDEGKNISIYVDKEIQDYLNSVDNVSEFIRQAIRERATLGASEARNKRMSNLMDMKLELQKKLMDIDLELESLGLIEEKLKRSEEEYSVKRNEHINKWHNLNPSIYHGNYWPDLSYFEGPSGLECCKECGFKTPEEAFNWFLEKKPNPRL